MADAHIRNEAGELRLLFEVSQVLDGAEDLCDHLEGALALMARYTGMMRGTLTLVDPATSEIVVEASYGLKAGEQLRARYKLGEGVTGKVIQTGTPMIVPHISQEPLFLNRTGARDLLKEDMAFLCVPICLDGRAVGALSADRLFADSVCLEEDLRLLQVLASLISRAVRIRRDFRAAHAAVVEENKRLRSLLHSEFKVGKLICGSAPMRSVLEELSQVAGSCTTVLIRGESGTGKELLAGIVHANSSRAGRPFVKVNCAALPEGLVESELFGHERGAFTGAVGLRKGRFEMAKGGTLFLDEVGDLTPPTQAKLLRALQEKEFERVGGTETLRADVRLIAATNRNLEEMVEKGDFRLDLYYRLNVFPVVLPPLRERRDDIMALASAFADKYGEAVGRKVRRITADAQALLLAHPWPGNVRELENALERAVILCGPGGIIDVGQLPAWLQSVGPESGRADASEGPPASLEGALEALERSLIEKALRETRGNMGRAARNLGITERILGLRMKKYGLDFRLFRLEELHFKTILQ